MKIWILNHYISNIDGPFAGGERHRNFSQELIKRGSEVALIYSSAEHNSDVNTMEQDKRKFKVLKIGQEYNVAMHTDTYSNNGIKRIKNMLQYYFGVLNNYKKIINETFSPELIMASSVHPLTCLAGLKIAKKLNLPCVIEIRDLWPLSIVEYKNMSDNNIVIKLLYKLEKYIYKNADALIFTMAGGKQYVIDKGLDKVVDINKIFNINNGVDILEQEKQKQEFQVEDKDLQDDSFKVIYAGSIREANGVGKILDIAEMSNKQSLDIKYIVYGKGADLETLKEQCVKRNLQNVLFKGYVSNKYIPYICSKASINIAGISDHNGIYKYGLSMNKIFTYLNAGKPIVIRHSNFDIIDHYRCGISVDSDDSVGYFKAIEKIYNASSSEYEKMCEASKNAAKDFDVPILVDKLEQVFEYAKINFEKK